MTALVVFESMFGNTRTVAEAIAAGLAAQMPVEVVEVDSAPDTLPADVTLLVVGGPTHAFGMTRANTRRDAAGKASTPVVSQGRGIREWLDELRVPAAPVAAAAFDTRVDKPRVPGSAAKAAHRRLGRLGLHLTVQPETFWVHDVQGPLTHGERDRGRRWGEQLARLLPAPSTG